MHVTREKYTARGRWIYDGERRRLEEEAIRRNVSENARYEQGGWTSKAEKTVRVERVRYLVRHVGYVNVIIPQILKGDLSRTRTGAEGCNRDE